MSAANLFDRLALLTTTGDIRHLGLAFARFMHSLGLNDTRALLAAVILSEIEGRGHTCLELADLARDPASLLLLRPEAWNALTEDLHWPETSAAWESLLSALPHIDSGATADQPLVLRHGRLYLRRYWHNECLIAGAVREKTLNLSGLDEEKVAYWLDRLFGAPETQQAESVDWQRIACAIAVRSKLSVITGGPGTGKTYTVARLLALLFALSAHPERLRIALAAPTGKAAARLKQSIERALSELAAKIGDALPLTALTRRIGAARTLHSLLGARPDSRAFRHHAGNPLDIDVLIVDEASMVHLEMMSALLEALPPVAALVLLGDKDQLASVEAGAVLGDLCRDADAGNYTAATLRYIQQTARQQLPDRFAGQGSALAQQTVMLRESRRFSGAIGALAQAVNQGEASVAQALLQRADEQVLCWLQCAQPQQMLALALRGREGAAGGYTAYLEILKRGPADVSAAAFEHWAVSLLKAFESFRILCAVRDGDWGVHGLNLAIEQFLHAQGLIQRSGEWYAGRPVMVTRNDYAASVFNGDIGIALPDPDKNRALRVYFLDGDALRSILASRLHHVETAYAMTIHKSQGSEFPHTVVVLPPDSSPILTKELLYTGITRASQRFTLATPVAAVLGAAILCETQRSSGLAEAIQ